ncbi:MAG: phosphocholine cytidylyltransferase family protein [Deltaproteobacteria bacterium]|nr:phosphocholine cytidylyltransferase family protein [Deltaproteobacteria bacterium]
MKALILAAGRGSRLGSADEGLHKCLLEVGRRPIIEHQLKALAETGIGPVGMVVGYSSEEVRERVGLRADFIPNPSWASTNSIYSFSLARDWIKGDLIILNCDTIFHPKILERLAATEGDAIAYDSNSGQGREHMKVNVESNRLLEMSKELNPELVTGENVGILKLTEKTVIRLLDKCDEIISSGGKNQWLGAALKELAKTENIKGVDIAGLPWCEIDFAHDLNRARKEIWPAIQKTHWKKTVRWRQSRWVMLLAILSLITTIAIGRVFTPPDITWVITEIEDTTDQVTIKSGERTRSMWPLKKNTKLKATVEGNKRVRIDSRLVMNKAVEDTLTYVLEVRVDGTVVNLHKHITTNSKTWQYQDSSVGKLRKIDLSLTPGVHTIEVTLLAADDINECLIVIKQEEIEETD